MQRIVDDHTKYMVRARPKCEMDGEIFGHRSANNSGRLYEPLYEYLNGITKDRVVTSCRLLLNRGAPSHPKVPIYPSTMLVYKETTHIPRDSDPLDRQAEDMGKPEGTMNHHLNLVLILII
jgi:hypothetical protein